LQLYYTAAWQVIEERVSASAAAAKVSYVWSPVYVDAMIARDRDGGSDGSLETRYYALHDANWNITGIVSTGGVVLERYTYDPYGARTIRDAAFWLDVGGSNFDWVHGHQGLRRVGSIDLIENRRRWYSNSLMRFVSADPIGFAGGYTNLYVYVGNNPAGAVDPWGLMTPEEEAYFFRYLKWTQYSALGVAATIIGTLAIIDAEYIVPRVLERGQKILFRKIERIVQERCERLGGGPYARAQDYAQLFAYARSHGLPHPDSSWLQNLSEEAVFGRAGRAASYDVRMGRFRDAQGRFTVSPPRGIWDLGSEGYGAAVEQILGGNTNALSGTNNFPTVDKITAKELVSIKSMDLCSNSYQTAEQILSKGKGYVNALAQFQGRTWGKLTITRAEVAARSRVLELAVPPGGGTPAQAAALQELQNYGRTQGVQVIIRGLQ